MTAAADAAAALAATLQGSEQAARAAAAIARTLREWLSNPALLEPPAVVLPHLIVEGRVSILSGREKIGKSCLVGGAVAAASRGDDVLGARLGAPVRCLWYAIDEPAADAVRRFHELGAAPDRVLLNDTPRTVGDLLAAIDADLTAAPVDCVVVDTLSRVLAASGVDPNSSRDVEPVMARLVDYFHAKGVGALLLYHTGKGGREYRGSTAIGATVDEILTLRRRGPADEDDFDDLEQADDGRRLLVQDGRNLRGRLHLAYAGGAYGLFDDLQPPRDRILEALGDHGAVAGRAELAKLAGVRKSAGLHLVAEMLTTGEIVADANGRLKLPPRPGSAGSRAPEPHAKNERREPAQIALPVPGSRRFPEGGTEPEPTREPTDPPPEGPGSRIGNPPRAETGTERPRRTVTGPDGRDVTEELRLTPHGDRWLEVAP